MARLDLAGPDGTRSIRIRGGTATIGRSPELEVVVDHPSVSRVHARVTEHDGAWVVRDLGSTNGTFVNGRRIKQAALADGDRLAVGEVGLGFSLAEPASSWDGSWLFAGVGRVLDRLGESRPAPERADEAGPLLAPLRQVIQRWEAAYRQLTVLYRIAHLLHGTEPLGTRVESAIKLAIPALKAERGFVLGYRPEKDELEVRLAFSRSEELPTTLDWIRAVARKVVETGQVLGLGPELAVGPPLTRPPTGRSMIAAPIKGNAGTYGVVLLDAPPGGSSWGKEEVDFVSTFAAQVGSTYERETLEAETAARRDAEHDLALARAIQARLLPARLPVVEGVVAHGASRPSREVGGDYFDAFPVGDGRLWFVVADVSGKGVPAALVQAQVRSLLRSLGRRGIPPEQAVEELGVSLLDDFGGRMFATVLAGVIDAASGRVSLVNAGHEYPWLHRVGEPIPVPVEHSDPPCGLFPGVVYRAHALELGPGDRLLIATDGIMDAESTQGERFGPPRLVELIRATRDLDVAHQVECIFAAVEEWGKGAPKSDDATVLALEFQGRGT